MTLVIVAVVIAALAVLVFDGACVAVILAAAVLDARDRRHSRQTIDIDLTESDDTVTTDDSEPHTTRR